MNLDFTEEQTAFRAALRDFFDKESPIAVVRASEPLGFDLTLWRKTVALGLGAIGVPEHQGGGGSGLLELVIAAECQGESLAPVPLVETSVTNNLLATLAQEAGEQVESLASGAISGDRLATTALHPAVDGSVRSVPAGAIADLVVVLDGDGLILLRRDGVSPAAPAPAASNLGALPIADCSLASGEALVLARGPKAVTAYRKAISEWHLLTAAALVGLAGKALQIGVDYAMQRRAFGVLIANFQTIQHRLADNVTALDGARLLVYEAAWAHDEGVATAQELATMAFLFASQTAFKTAAESLHFHGGYGYTLEYDIQLYFRRAKAWPLVAGDPQLLHAELAHRLFAPEAV